MRLIVGLGNPGKQYQKTRHNVGFMVLDALREKLTDHGASMWELSKKFNAEVSGCVVNGQKILLVKPMTFMNASGDAIQLIGHFYKAVPGDIVLVHDEKDLKLGDVRVQTNRGPAGHNGVQSVIDRVGTQDFLRIRVGIAPEDSRKMDDVPKFVLSKFGLFERRKVEEVVARAVEEIMQVLK